MATSKSKSPGKPGKKATDAARPRPVLVTETRPDAAAPDLKKRELIDLVVERSGVKKRDAKPAVEAVLAVLGEAVAAGRDLNLQPFGKLRVNRSKKQANGQVSVCKLRQSAPRPDRKAGDEPLAEPAD